MIIPPCIRKTRELRESLEISIVIFRVRSPYTSISTIVTNIPISRIEIPNVLYGNGIDFSPSYSHH